MTHEEANILNGKEIAKSIREDLKSQVIEMQKNSGPICLATMRIGAFEDAKLYQDSIERLMNRFEITHKKIELDESSDPKSQLDAIIKDSSVTGVLILSPIPNHLNYESLVDALPIHKDAEGTRYSTNTNGISVYPPTALAVLETVLSADSDLTGKEAVVVGRSSRVGKPVADLLLQRNATVTICHSKTKDLEFHIKRADIVVAAVGVPRLIKGEWIKEGAIVSDAGENFVDGKLTGDVDFEKAKERAGFITPVPSGVGPLTSLMLVKNLLSLKKLS